VNLLRNPWYALAASLLVCFGLWHWARVFAAPAYTAKALAGGRPIGNNSDLYPYWLGTRELLLHGRDPYGSDVTREIQAGFYGRPLDPQKPSDPKDQEAFAYPLYVIFMLAPTVASPFRVVAGTFRWLLLCAIACSVPLWMYAIGFRPRRLLVVSGMVLAVGSFPAVQEFYMQNLTALVLLFLAAAAAATVRGWLLPSGFLLALSTIKPQLSGLFIFFFLLWSTAQWAKRQGLFWSFLVSLAALVIAAESVSYGWIGRFLTLVRAYLIYAADPPILKALLPSWLATPVAALLVGLLVLHCWRWRTASAGTEDFGWALAWIATATLALIPKLAAYSQPLLIPAWLVLLAHRKTIWKAGLIPRALVKAAFACQLWQWGAALLLSVCSLLIAPARLRVLAEIPMYTSLASWPITLLAVAVATLSLGHVSRQDPRATLPDPQTPAAPHG
jgi:hypothetical protein